MKLLMAAVETSTLVTTRLHAASVTKRMLRTPPVWAALSEGGVGVAVHVTKLGKSGGRPVGGPARRDVDEL